MHALQEIEEDFWRFPVVGGLKMARALHAAQQTFKGGESPADGPKYTSQRAEVAITQPQGETGLSGATAHFPNLKSRYSEPQATRKNGSFEKVHFSLTRGLAQVSLIETIKPATSRLRLDLS